MFGRDPWGGSLEIHTSHATDDDASIHTDRAARTRTRHLEETQQSWLLAPTQPKNKKQVNLGCVTVSRTIFIWTISIVAFSAVLVAAVVTIVKTVPRHQAPPAAPDDYFLALHKALMFFNAQKSGKLPNNNNITWRGNSCERDGLPDTIYKDLEGGYYDAGDAIKFHFPQAFAMTMLSWSVIEYRSKYETIGEIEHVLEIIRWGMDYFLKTFNSSSTSINTLISQVGSGAKTTDQPNDHSCWMRPEDIDYTRPVVSCSACSDLASEMAAALAAGSIVFKKEREYSSRLVNGAKSLYAFGRRQRGRYSGRGSEAALFYNSTSYWDEFVWGGTWMYYATGNASYLDLVTNPVMAKHAGAFWGGPDYGVFSWDSKLPGAQVLLSRMRLFMSPGYPYEDILGTFHVQTGLIMCSYLPDYRRFNRTPGGMIQLNHGRSQPLQYVVNAAYLASLFSDYLETAGVPGWYCGPRFYTLTALRDFARSQLDYILGRNPLKLSYLVGWGPKFPQQVHHRGASIPPKVRVTCQGGLTWRDSKNPNPNVVVGAMVAGPDIRDAFLDVRSEYNYTEPTLAGNAGLVAALVASGGPGGIDKNGIFSAVPQRFPFQSPPPVPWKP